MRARLVSTGEDVVILSAGTMKWWADKASGKWIAFHSRHAVRHETTVGPFDTFDDAAEAAKDWDEDHKPKKKGE